MRSVVLGGGCFWGVEELMRTRPGVIDTEVGYAGGKNSNPTYEFHPGHAEVVKIEYEETATSLDELLGYFFRIHDPTTKNRQGNDVGSSYRSIIFYANDAEKRSIENVITAVEASRQWANSIVTEVVPLAQFYPAEEYHQDYLQKHPGGYTCHFERPAVK
ncbi:MAG: peptide-methionine (S)-S-oxide reductase MsrA [Candidatus Saccharibacteria bacterium]|nr:peptide-methionine (S)-S-oxide reductase MsrA [Candidatus Saccharibacteria bacterium]